MAVVEVEAVASIEIMAASNSLTVIDWGNFDFIC